MEGFKAFFFFFLRQPLWVASRRQTKVPDNQAFCIMEDCLKILCEVVCAIGSAPSIIYYFFKTVCLSSWMWNEWENIFTPSVSPGAASIPTVPALRLPCCQTRGKNATENEQIDVQMELCMYVGHIVGVASPDERTSIKWTVTQTLRSNTYQGPSHHHHLPFLLFCALVSETKHIYWSPELLPLISCEVCSQHTVH